MGFHHVALATRDLAATHVFYTEAMSFELVKVVAAPTRGEGTGWARHLFYDTGGQGLIAFWDLHDETIPTDCDPAISTGLGLPVWANHLAFDTPGLDALEQRKRRWLDAGHDVAEIDHGWCTSIYTTDPNGILVEFCCTTAGLTRADRDEAQVLLRAEQPPLEVAPKAIVHRAEKAPAC